MALLMTKHLCSISDNKPRCGWVGGKPHFIAYHDREWGVPIHDDRKHFEMLLLEGAQAGLTWETILLRRDGYRRAFAEFDPKKVARFTAKKKAVLLKNHGIIRNRLKGGIPFALVGARYCVIHAPTRKAQRHACFQRLRYIWPATAWVHRRCGDHNM
jgi:hypothetical protein